MPEPTKVWMVQLDRSPDDIEGTLSLEDATLRFDSPSVGIRTIALETVQRVKRIWGSPVLLVHWLEDGVRRVTAFYFSKPPPLHPEMPDPNAPPPTTIAIGRNRTPSRRRQRRTNAGYLASVSANYGQTVKDWHRAAKTAIATAKRETGER
jgi:hypothetical protein